MGNDQAIHHIKFDGESAPQVGSRDHYSGYSATEIRTMLESTNPRAIEDAGHAYNSAKTMLDGTEGLIRVVAGELSGVWSGDASIEAQKALQLVHKTVQELATRCGQLGPPLTYYGKEILPSYINNAAKSGWFEFDDGLDLMPGDNFNLGTFGGIIVTDKSENDLAREDLMELNKELISLYDNIPATVEKDLPRLNDPVNAPLTDQNYRAARGNYPAGRGIPAVASGLPGGGAGFPAAAPVSLAAVPVTPAPETCPASRAAIPEVPARAVPAPVCRVGATIPAAPTRPIRAFPVPATPARFRPVRVCPAPAGRAPVACRGTAPSRPRTPPIRRL